MAWQDCSRIRADAGPPLITAKRGYTMTVNNAHLGKRQRLATRSACAAAFLLALWASAACAQTAALSDAERRCGPVATVGHYGPFDYRTSRATLAIVERHHFTPQVEAGERGQSGNMERDIAYTLKSSPNHHRALLTLVNLGAKTKSLQPGELEYSIECFFDRAVRYQPNDGIVRMIYAKYLGNLGRTIEAKQQLGYAINSADENPLTHHNIGLVFIELGDHDAALVQAHRARKLGFENSRLENVLKSQNKWKEPTE